MTVIIDNELPQNCSSCNYHNGCGACMFGDEIRVNYEANERPEYCPLISVADLKAKIEFEKNWLKDVMFEKTFTYADIDIAFSGISGMLDK